IIMLGTNDLRNRWRRPEEEVTAAQMIAGLNQLAVRGRTRGIKVITATLTPFENETFLPGAWNPKREAIRQEVNDWMRKTDAFDAIVDFDRALRDPEHPTRMLPIYDATTIYTRATSATARWVTRSICRCSTDGSRNPAAFSPHARLARAERRPRRRLVRAGIPRSSAAFHHQCRTGLALVIVDRCISDRARHLLTDEQHGRSLVLDDVVVVAFPVSKDADFTGGRRRQPQADRRVVGFAL